MKHLVDTDIKYYMKRNIFLTRLIVFLSISTGLYLFISFGKWNFYWLEQIPTMQNTDRFFMASIYILLSLLGQVVVSIANDRRY